MGGTKEGAVLASNGSGLGRRSRGERRNVEGSPARRGLMLAVVVALLASWMPLASAGASGSPAVLLTNDDFTYGTYVIDQPGVYRLAEDITFNPNSVATLNAAIASGDLPAPVAVGLGLSVPVDAYGAGRPLPTQFLHGPNPAPFTPGGPMDARYDPAAYGVGFFAAIAIEADGVVLDLDGHHIEQHPEHALLQRFFSVIELADQPFIPAQGPAGFGLELTPARNVTIKDGSIGRSSHHGIHGNANENVTIRNVEFVDFEVGAVALNGVERLRISRAEATNRKDVPVLGTFSAARFISAYVDHLVASGSTTTLRVGGSELTATQIRDALRASINNVHHDVVVDPHMADGRASIDPSSHPHEYALFHNPFGVVDGNSYGFLVNQLGVAVNGFPHVPTGPDASPSSDIVMREVSTHHQHAFINEIPALDANGPLAGRSAAIDPVGAVFQVRNVHPDTGTPVTVSSADDAAAVYVGNVLADAQALVAKAVIAGDFAGSHLDVTRSNIGGWVIDWIESETTLATAGASYVCNGDSMFHVNKGVIGFKIDSADDVRLHRTEVHDLRNLGSLGSNVCGDGPTDVSHPIATLPGYGGNIARGYTFAGTTDARLTRSSIDGVDAATGAAIGVEVLTDSTNVTISNLKIDDVRGGALLDADPTGPNHPAVGVGVRVGADTSQVRLTRACVQDIEGFNGDHEVEDLSGDARIRGRCPRR